MTVDFFAAARAAAERKTALRAQLEPHRSECADYFRALWAGAAPGCMAFVGPKRGSTPAPQHVRLSGADTAWRTLADLTIEAALVRDVYCAIAPNRAEAGVGGIRHGVLAEKASVGVLWADFDVGAGKRRASEPGHPPFFASVEVVLEFVSRLNLKPSMLVASGGGLHVYWALGEHTNDLAAVQALANSLQRDLQRRARALLSPAYGPDLTPAPTQLLRPAGTFNWKAGEPRVVRLVDLNDRRYDLAELRAEWPPSPARRVFAAPAARAEEMTEAETWRTWRSEALRAIKYEYRPAVLRILNGESWTDVDQELTLTRVAWFLCRACGWRPSTDAVLELCDLSADSVVNTRPDEPWTSEQIHAKFRSAISRGLAAAERDNALRSALMRGASR